jgi:hypothetical protein
MLSCTTSVMTLAMRAGDDSRAAACERFQLPVI